MFQIRPFLSAASFVLPNCPNLPVELWAMILRFLDPASLLTIVKASPYWSSISKGDPVLSATVRRQLTAERERHQAEILNPGLLITVRREEPGGVFQSNGRKTVQRRAPTLLHTSEGFLQGKDQKRSAGGPIRNKCNGRRSKPHKSLRC
ncbi:unnamed protein product [Tenebrio molitor]|nr:unnamed protein product [Tenebrio molitor]